METAFYLPQVFTAKIFGRKGGQHFADKDEAAVFVGDEKPVIPKDTKPRFCGGAALIDGGFVAEKAKGFSRKQAFKMGAEFFAKHSGIEMIVFACGIGREIFPLADVIGNEKDQHAFWGKVKSYALGFLLVYAARLYGKGGVGVDMLFFKKVFDALDLVLHR